MHTYRLIFILLLSLFLNLLNNDFPVEYHGDEIKKVTFIKEMKQDFMHPILLLQVPRSINAFLDLSNPLAVAILGRAVSALCTTLMVLVSYFLARRVMSAWGSLLVALAVCLAPMVVIHAHYLKEDMIFTLFLLLSTLCFLRFRDKPTPQNILWLGISMGCCFSSKYVGGIVVVVFLILSLKNIKKFFCCAGIAFVCFAIINYPLFFQLQQFFNGFSRELNHALEGHSGAEGLIAISAREFFLGFHFLYSLIPGMTLALAVAGGITMLVSLVKWKTIPFEERLFLIIALVYYLSAELSPLKAFPDFMRYMLPLSFFIAYFAIKGLSSFGVLGKIAAVASLCYALWDTSHLVYHLNRDTRLKAKEWLVKNQEKIKGDQYATFVRGAKSIATLNLNDEKTNGTKYLLASSFFYDRVFFAQKLKVCPGSIKQSYRNYQVLFTHPFIEIKPAYKSFAFSNPTIRIINISE